MKIEIKKEKVVEIFDQIASHYDQHAVLMQYVGQEILRRLSLLTIDVRVMLDLGAGTGFFSDELKKIFPQATLVAIDCSQQMLKINSALNKIQTIAEQLPIKNNSIDFIFANLLLPWCANVDEVLRECRRVLKPNGLLFFSSFGPNHGLPDMHDVGDALVNVGFIDPVMEVEYVELNYSSVENMQAEMAVTGLSDFFEAAEKNITIEVVYGHAWCGDKHIAAMNELGEAAVSLDSIRHLFPRS